MANKMNFFVVSLIAMMAVAPAVADTPASQEWTKDRYDSKISTINSRLATAVRDKIYIYDGNKQSQTYGQPLDPLHTTATTAFSGINEVLEKVDGNDGTANSAVTLDTTAKNAFGAINELKSAIDNIDIPEQVQPDWEATTGKAAILHKPDIPAAQVQSDWTQADNTQVDFIKNKPTLATVATSGDYDDLTNKPTIPAAQVNADWNAESGVAQILNKPTIPSLDGYATESYVDTQIGELDIPAAQVQADWNATEGMGAIKNKPTLAAVATSGDYDDLTNKPTIPAAQVQSDWNATEGMGVIKNKPTLAAVATSGDYEDLTNQPTIPVVDSSLDGQSSNAIANSAVVTALAGKQNNLTFDATPTANSTNPVTSGGIYTAINAMSGDVQAIGEQIEDALEAYTPTTTLQANYALKSELPTVDTTLDDQSNNPIANSAVATALDAKVDSADLAAVATSGDYDDLTNKPTIPAAQVNADWNASQGVAQILNKPTIPVVDATLDGQSNNAIANSAVVTGLAGKVDVATPGTGQWVLGYVDDVLTYIPIIDANGNYGASGNYGD